MIISAILAISDNHVIGKENGLPWHLPADLKHFKRTTLGKSVIMGRKTWDSLHGKPLPKRKNIVVSRQPQPSTAGEIWVSALEEAVRLCEGEDEIFIVGGAQLYSLALDKQLIDRIYLTRVHADVEGDTFFEVPDLDKWKITDIDARQADDDNEFAFTLLQLERNK